MTEKLTKAVADCSTGIVTIVELTDEEMQQLEIDRAEYQARSAAIAEAEAAKAAAKASAEAKLAALGLTPEEIAALR
jgi:hypothetical protein